MKYDVVMNNIKSLLNDYKKQIDEVVTEITKKRAEIQKQETIYQESYINERLAQLDGLAGGKMGVIRSKTRPMAEYYFDLLKKEMDSFFKGDISPEISNKAQTLRTLDLKLNQREFDALMQGAKSYYDLRILSKMAQDMKLNYNSSIDSAFSDIERAYTELNNYKGSVLSAIDYYAGENGELHNSLPLDEFGQVVVPWAWASAGKVFTNSLSQNAYNDIMQKLLSVLPEKKIKLTLTEKDKKLIDSIIDPKYPALAREQVKEICSLSEDLSELLALDNRYAKYVFEYNEEQKKKAELEKELFSEGYAL